ncbi:MAG: DNA/RNA non-specific endonuclease [Flavobacteriales bacterium]
MDLSNLKRETRYGVPAADQILFNRHYVLGYSYYFRQAKWALEIIDPSQEVSRKDHFRSDYRIPERFRADKEVYEHSGLDRGHLVASLNQSDSEIQNSETFLLSNMCPQIPSFNSGVWKRLETAIRTLDSDKKVLETYVISGPIFFFDQEVKMMGDDVKGIDVTLPIPHAFYKSVLTERNTGTINIWSFIIPNATSDLPLEDYRVETSKLEKIAGLTFWEALKGSKMKGKKDRIRKMWRF